jgi:hypothetical protein
MVAEHTSPEILTVQAFTLPMHDQNARGTNTLAGPEPEVQLRLPTVEPYAGSFGHRADRPLPGPAESDNHALLAQLEIEEWQIPIARPPVNRLQSHGHTAGEIGL